MFRRMKPNSHEDFITRYRKWYEALPMDEQALFDKL